MFHQTSGESDVDEVSKKSVVRTVVANADQRNVVKFKKKTNLLVVLLKFLMKASAAELLSAYLANRHACRVSAKVKKLVTAPYQYRAITKL